MAGRPALLIVRYCPNRFCVKNVSNGKLTVLLTLEDYFKDFKSSTCKISDSIFDLKRFDQLLLGLSFKESEYHYTFVTLDLKNGKKVTEIQNSRVVKPVYFMNWNLEEAAVTFYDRDRFHNGLYFKVCRVNESNPNISQKHLARLAVLTSFCQDYLMIQNMPSSIFRYLGL